MRELRERFFKVAHLPPYCFELDENGIPAIAYWNTKGDTPIKAEQLVDRYAYLVTYERDKSNQETM